MNLYTERKKWILDDQENLAQVSFNWDRRTLKLIDKNTITFTTQYNNKEQAVYSSESKNQLVLTDIALEGINIQDFILNHANKNYFALNTNPNYFNSAYHSDRTFSATAKAVSILTISSSSNDSSSLFNEYAHIVDSSFSDIKTNNLSLNQIAANHYGFNVPCYSAQSTEGSSNTCYIMLYPSDNNQAGNAELVRIYHSNIGEIADYQETLTSFRWEKSVLYGKDSLVFDNNTLQKFTTVEALIEVETGNFIKLLNADDQQNDVKREALFNKDALFDIRAVIEDAVMDSAMN